MPTGRPVEQPALRHDGVQNGNAMRRIAAAASIMAKQTVHVGLIRAIGPETHKVMSMQQLREACAAAGLQQVSTYIASGNLLFRSSGKPEKTAALVEKVIKGFGLSNKVFLRTPDELDAAIAANPYPDAVRDRPSRVLVSFMDFAPVSEALGELEKYQGPECFTAIGRDLYIDYADGVGTSKLTGSLIERRLGQPGTARNWNTIVKLAELGHAKG